MKNLLSLPESEDVSFWTNSPKIFSPQSYETVKNTRDAGTREYLTFVLSWIINKWAIINKLASGLKTSRLCFTQTGFSNSEVFQTVYLNKSVWFVQTPSTQSQPETPLQSELLPELTGSAQSPPAEHIVTPPSTVDTAALSEEPLPGEGGVCFTAGSSDLYDSTELSLLDFLKLFGGIFSLIGSLQTGNMERG